LGARECGNREAISKVGAKVVGLCNDRHFRRPHEAQLLQEAAFGLLQALGGFGIADRRGDVL